MLLRRFARGAAPVTGGGTPSTTHPRLFLTPSTLAAFRTKIGTDYVTEYQAIVDYAASFLASPVLTYSQPSGDFEAINNAFIYAVGTVPNITYSYTLAQHGQRAVDIVELWRQRADNLIWWFTTPGLQVVYDWAYPLLNTTQKAYMVNVMKGLAFQSGVVQSVVDHFDGLYINASLLSGLAHSGDGIDDAAAATDVARWSVSSHNTDTGILDGYSYFAGTDGGFAELTTYATVEMTGMMPLFLMLEGYRTANSLTRAETFGASYANVLRYFPQWVAYRIRPWAKASSFTGGKEWLLYSDAANMDNPVSAHHAIGGATGLVQVLKACTSYSGLDDNMAGLARWLLDNRVGDYPNYAYGWDHASQVWADFILGSKSASALSPTTLNLPLSKYFEKMGQIVMRTGWTSVNDTYVTFNATKWERGAGGTCDGAAGYLTIDRNGPLLINAGTGIHQDYSHATFAYNIPTFVDPNEAERGSGAGGANNAGKRDTAEWDMGAQRNKQTVSELTSLSLLIEGGLHDFGGISRYRLYDAALSDVDYAYVDLTPAYNSVNGYHDAVNTQKVTQVTRHFVYFRRQSDSATDQVIVYDRQTTPDTKFLKRNRWHISADPTINGTSTAVRTGLTTYAGATLATVTNINSSSDGKMFISPLLPASVTIRKVGGPNASGTWTTVNAGGVDGYRDGATHLEFQTVTDAHEFEDPYGLNWWGQFQNAGSTLTDAEARQYYGPYHLEIQPTTDALYDQFLTVFEVGTGSSTQSTTQLWSGTNFKAARCGNRIAVFADTETTRSSGTLVFEKLGSYKVLWGDLTGTTRSVVGGGNISVVTNAVTGTGSSPFTVDSGSKTLYLTITVTADGTGASNTVTIS